METKYLLIKVMAVGPHPDQLTIDPIGLYDDPEDAEEWIDKLDKLNTEPEAVIFDFMPLDTGAEPIVLPMMEQVHLEESNIKTAYVQDLMDKEYAEQLIGEDGGFYWRITDKGKDAMEKSQKIRRLLNALFGEVTDG